MSRIQCEGIIGNLRGGNVTVWDRIEWDEWRRIKMGGIDEWRTMMREMKQSSPIKCVCVFSNIV